MKDRAPRFESSVKSSTAGRVILIAMVFGLPLLLRGDGCPTNQEIVESGRVRKVAVSTAYGDRREAVDVYWHADAELMADDLGDNRLRGVVTLQSNGGAVIGAGCAYAWRNEDWNTEKIGEMVSGSSVFTYTPAAPPPPRHSWEGFGGGLVATKATAMFTKEPKERFTLGHGILFLADNLPITFPVKILGATFRLWLPGGIIDAADKRIGNDGAGNLRSEVEVAIKVGATEVPAKSSAFSAYSRVDGELTQYEVPGIRPDISGDYIQGERMNGSVYDVAVLLEAGEAGTRQNEVIPGRPGTVGALPSPGPSVTVTFAGTSSIEHEASGDAFGFGLTETMFISVGIGVCLRNPTVADAPAIVTGAESKSELRYRIFERDKDDTQIDKSFREWMDKQFDATVFKKMKGMPEPMARAQLEKAVPEELRRAADELSRRHLWSFNDAKW